MCEHSFIYDNKQKLKHLSQMLYDVPNYPCDSIPIAYSQYEIIPVNSYPYNLMDCECATSAND